MIKVQQLYNQHNTHKSVNFNHCFQLKSIHKQLSLKRCRPLIIQTPHRTKNSSTPVKTIAKNKKNTATIPFKILDFTSTNYTPIYLLQTTPKTIEKQQY